MNTKFIQPSIQKGWNYVGRSQVNWKNTKTRISLPLLSQLFLKYADTVDVLIRQFIHTKFSDGTFENPFCQ